jgi:hypothetical protein
MKKLIVMAAAAGALAVGGAASAQDFGSVLGSIFGFGTPQYSYGTPQYPYGAPQYPYGGSSPAVVAGTVPYGSTVYVDQYGRQVHVDQWGRHVVIQQQPQSSTYIVGYDQWGRPIYGASPYGSNTYGNYAYANPNDRDGDGVLNRYDRWPDDRRYR